MGISGFHKYCKQQVPDSHKYVNMMESFEGYRKKTGKDPVVMISLANFAMVYQRSNSDGLFGYRYNVILRHFEEFLMKLKEAGVKMIFPIHKRTMEVETKLDQYLKQVEKKYKETCKIINKIKEIKSVSELRILLGGDMKDEFNFWFPTNTIIKYLLLDIAKEYGEIYGTSATPNMHVTLRDEAQLAEERGVFAVLGFESNYLIHGGYWKYWCINDINFESMEISEFNRDAIKEYLGLSYELMPLFVILTGSDLLDEEHKIHLRFSKFGPKKYFFMNVAKFITAKKRFPLTDKVWKEIANEIYKNAKATDFLNSIKTIYKTLTCNESMPINNPLIEMVIDSPNNLAYDILEKLTLILYPDFIDYRKTDMFQWSKTILPLLLNTAGILLKYRQEANDKIRVYYKKSHDKLLEFESYEPNYLELEVPNIELMLSGQFPDTEKFELLIWLLDLHVEVECLQEIPFDFLFIILSLNYLIQLHTLKKIEATGILKTLIQEKLEPIPDDIDYPENTDERALRVAFVFVKFFKFLQACVSAVGFKDYKFELRFDAVYYQKHFVELIKEAEEPHIEETDDDVLKMLSKLVTDVFPK